jgi:hypothetical protein
MSDLGSGAPLASLAWRCFYKVCLYVGRAFSFVSCGAYLGDGGLLFVVLKATEFVIFLGGLSLARMLNPMFIREL